MAENIIIRQGIQYDITAKTLPHLEKGEWIAVLYSKSTNRRYVATRKTEGTITRFIWESGMKLDGDESNPFVDAQIDPDAINSTAHMKEGLYELEFVSSDLTKGGGMASRGRKFEVIKSSLMTKKS